MIAYDADLEARVHHLLVMISRCTTSITQLNGQHITGFDADDAKAHILKFLKDDMKVKFPEPEEPNG